MKILGISFLLFCSFIVATAGPNWERVNYRNSTVFSGIVTINGKPAAVGDIVGAFVGNECRMIATVFIHNDSTFVSAVIHGEMVETISFRIWVKSENKEYNLKETVLSKPGDGLYLHKLPFIKQ